MKKSIKLLLSTFLAGAAVLSVTSCGNSDKTVVRIGVCGTSNDYWKAVQYVLDQENANIDIDLVTFSAYNLPNNALNAGEIDLNSFQHKAYLAKEVEANGYKIEAIGDTLIAPLTIYSKKYSSVDELKSAAGIEIKEDGKINIAVPNDATNQARGIKLLEQAGLITLNESAGYNPTLTDITSYLYNIEITSINANSLATQLDEFGAATINGTYAIPAGLQPTRDGLLIESTDRNSASDSGNPYVNIIVARTSEKDNENYKKIVDAYHSDAVGNYIISKYNEAFFPVFEYNKLSGTELTDLINTIDEIEL